MEISDEPILAGFEEALRCYPLASRAKRRPLPGSDEAQAITAGSGRQCAMLLDVSSPFGVFSKILLGSSHWTASAEYCYVWNRLDTKFGCSAFQLTQLEPSTSDTECSLFATPQAHDQHQGNADRVGRFGTAHGGRNLTDEVMRLLPTPTVPNGGRVNPPETSLTGAHPDGRKRQIDLREAVQKLWPTPTLQCGTHNAGPSQYNRNSDPLDVVAAKMSNSVSGSLNPRFVEELMGFPIDHTALKRSETPSFRSRRTRSLRLS